MCLPHCRQVPCRLRCGAGCGSRCPSLPTDAGVRGPAAEASLTLSGIMPLLARGLVCALGARRLSSGPGCGSRAKLWAQKVRWCCSSGSPTPRPLESTRGTDAAWTWSSTVFPRGGRHSAATPRLSGRRRRTERPCGLLSAGNGRRTLSCSLRGRSGSWCLARR